MIQKEKEKDTKAYRQGYFHHMIAKVLELSQVTVWRIIKMNEVCDSISIT